MCKYEIIMFPFCGHPYLEVAPKFATYPYDGDGNQLCCRYKIHTCDYATTAGRACVTFRTERTIQFRCAIARLPDTVISVNFGDCNLPPGEAGCRKGTPQHSTTDQFGRPVMVDGKEWKGVKRKILAGEEDSMFLFMKQLQRNVPKE